MKILATLIGSAALGFINTNAGRKLYVCATPQPTALDAAGYAALTWVLVGGVGNLGETGSKTNILNYETWDDDTIDKAKGLTDAGSPDLEVRRDYDDAGQVILLAAAATNFTYAFKIVGNDKPNATGTPTIRYNRGLISGPTQPNGRNEDFDIEMYSLGLQQRQITVLPTVGS